MQTYMKTSCESRLGCPLILAACLALHPGLLAGQTSMHQQPPTGENATQSRLKNSEPALTAPVSVLGTLKTSADGPAVSATQSPALVVHFEAGSVSIHAKGSTLFQILREVSAVSGMQVEGLNEDEQVFGSFGPGEPQVVLLALLSGTRYNTVMVGRLKDGAPRALLLSGRRDAEAPAQPPPPAAAAEDAPAVEDVGTAIADAAPNETRDAPLGPLKTPEDTLDELQRLQAEHPHP